MKHTLMDFSQQIAQNSGRVWLQNPGKQANKSPHVLDGALTVAMYNKPILICLRQEMWRSMELGVLPTVGSSCSVFVKSYMDYSRR